MILGLDHVQLAMPEGEEARARRFYGELLGLTEVEKPEALRARGGVWFGLGAQGLHLGVEEGFKPAKKAHPAILVRDLAILGKRLRDAQEMVTWDDTLLGYQRFYSEDPFGNRLEFLELLEV